MADRDDGRTNRDDERAASERASNERAAAETREPERAARVRAEDDAATRARQDATSEDLGQAARLLADSQRTLRETRDALQATGRDISRSSEAARDVLENASSLRAEAEEIAQAVREVPLRLDAVSDDTPRGDPRRDDDA
jgi:hypothetical protein